MPAATADARSRRQGDCNWGCRQLRCRAAGRNEPIGNFSTCDVEKVFVPSVRSDGYVEFQLQARKLKNNFLQQLKELRGEVLIFRHPQEVVGMRHVRGLGGLLQ